MLAHKIDPFDNMLSIIFSDNRRLLSGQSNKDPSWKETRPFSAQNSKDEPNPRVARVWQEVD